MNDIDAILAWLGVLVVVYGLFLAFLRARDWFYDNTPLDYHWDH